MLLGQCVFASRYLQKIKKYFVIVGSTFFYKGNAGKLFKTNFKGTVAREKLLK